MISDLPPAPDPSKFAIDYIKSNAFRVIHADGVMGGGTPGGKLHMTFYSERPCLPRRHVFVLNPDGTLGEPLAEETISRGSVVREMDIDVIMDIQVAEEMLKWMTARVKELRQLRLLAIRAQKS